jgi:MFS family permease
MYIGRKEGTMDATSTKPVVLRSARDVIDFVNDHPTGSKRGQIIIWIALGSIFIDAYDFTSLAIGIPSLKAQLHPTPFELGNVTAIMAFGALIGALAGGYLVDKLGRYKLLILDLFLFVIAALGAALAPNLEVLLVFRFLLGVGVGIDMPAALSLASEFSRSKEKGKFVNFWQPMWFIATCSSALIVLPIFLLGAGDNLWRWAVGFGAVPALIILILRFVYADESPLWAAHNLGVETAAGILRKNYPNEFIVDAPESEKKTVKVNVRDVFHKKYRSRTVLVSIICGFQAMQYFAVGFYLPVMVALIFGNNTVEIVFGTVVLNIFGILGGGTQPFLTEKLGLRKLAMIGSAVCGVSLILVGTLHGNVSPLLSAFLIGIFMFGHSFGPGSQGKTMAALSYPTELRGTGTGWAEAMSRVGSIGGFYLFPLVLVAIGLAQTLLLLAAIPLIMLVSLAVIRWEPTTVDVEDVDVRSTNGSQGADPSFVEAPM